MMPAPDQFGQVMSKYGIGNNSKVVIYDRTSTTWATRLWWMLRAAGFDNATILNGGFQKWQAEKRPTTDRPGPVSSGAKFVVHPRPDIFVGKAEVVNAFDTKNAALICSLSQRQYDGGHIPGSLNIEYSSLQEPQSNAFLPMDRMRKIFENAGLSANDRIIVYCNRGISATLNAFVLTMLDYGQVSVYDGSLEEWRKDPFLPLVRPAN
jgi:thiosulfate/3-mercaptopyruvate sulfurtransferase